MDRAFAFATFSSAVDVWCYWCFQLLWNPCCCWRFSIAGVSGLHAVIGFPASAGVPAVAGIPAVAGDPAVAVVLLLL